MYKKLLISLGILLSIVFTFTLCSANNGLQDAANVVRDVVGGAENAIENGVKDISNASKNATGAMENAANNTTNAMTNNGNNNNTHKDTNNNTMRTTTNNNGNYTATRTATNQATFMGMNATAWTWLILGIATIAIVALVWYYSMQLRDASSHND